MSFDCGLRQERSALRSGRRLLFSFSFLIFTTFSLSTYDLMDGIPVLADQSLFLGAAPTFDLMLMGKCFMIRFCFLCPDQLDGAAPVGVSAGAKTLFVFPNAPAYIVCAAGIVGAIRAFKDVHVIRHIFTS